MLRFFSTYLGRYHHRNIFHFLQNPKSYSISIIPVTTSAAAQPPSSRPHHRPLSYSSSQNHRYSDDYFAVVHHISNIVRHDYFLERTLGKLRGLIVSAELVYRVIRASSPTKPLESLRFFHWARATHSGTYKPTTLEIEELVLALGRGRHWESMWKTAELMRSLSFPLSSSTFASIIESYGRNGLTDKAVEVFNRMRHFNCPQTIQVFFSFFKSSP